MPLPRFTLPGAAADFLREHWQRSACFMPGAARGLDSLDRDTLAGLALESAIESRLIQGRDTGPWQLRHGPFELDDLQSLPERDWTLLVQSVDHALTDVSLLLDDFRFVPGWRLEDIMVSYAVTGGGVGPHYDQYDVFLLQASGHRRWRLGPVCDEHSPRQPHDQLRLLADMPVQAEHLCGPGDVLYLPPGVAHWGVAEDDDCITWSVGFRAPRLADLLARIADEVLMDSPGTLFSDPGRVPAERPGRLEEDDARRLADAALGLLDTHAARTALAAFLSEPRAHLLEFDTDLERIRRAHPDTGLVRHGSCRLVSVPGALWLNGEPAAVSAASQPLADYLAGQRRYDAAELAARMTDEGSRLINEWIEQGYFLPL